MRKILFRGRRLDNGGWVEGYYMTDPLGAVVRTHKIIKNKKGDTHVEQSHRVDPTTVGQFTGLLDKNGVRVFEGDIIKTHYKNAMKSMFVEEVVFYNGAFKTTCEIDGGRSWCPLADGVPHIGGEVYTDEMEVIGNIHEKEAPHGRKTQSRLAGGACGGDQ